MPAPHPTDRTLAALVDGRLDVEAAASTREHVRGCARCQLRIGASGSAVTDQRPAEVLSAEVPLVEETVSDPAQGDVWRLTWDTNALLAVIWRVDIDRIAVLPVVESADADDWCTLLDSTVTGGLGDLAVSVAYETTVPWAVLDACVASLNDLGTLETLRFAFKKSAATTVSRGEPIHSSLDERLIGLDEIATRLAELANAEWTPPVAAPATGVVLDYDTLINAGLPPQRALAISIRGEPPNDDDADAIAAVTGRRPAAPPVDEDLRRKIDLPRRKAAIRQRARQNGRSEGAERLVLAREAHPSLAAARGTGGVAPDFDTILDRLLRG